MEFLDNNLHGFFLLIQRNQNTSVLHFQPAVMKLLSCQYVQYFFLVQKNWKNTYPHEILITVKTLFPSLLTQRYSETCLSWPPTVPETVVNISKWSTYTNVFQNNFQPYSYFISCLTYSQSSTSVVLNLYSI